MIEFLIASLIALALDRLLPDRAGFDPFQWYRHWVDSIEQRYNGGSREQGWVATALALIPIAVGILILRFVLGELAWLLRFSFDVAILYFCIDLNRLNDKATELAEALEEGRLLDANSRLRELRGVSARETEEEISSASVEAVLYQANAVAIAPLFWFLLLGPMGAAVQRMVSLLDHMWGRDNERFAQFGQSAVVLNNLAGWVPARISAISFAVVGNFEDAVHNWRRQAGVWSDNISPLRAAGFGAMHLRLQDIEDTEDSGLLDEPAPGHVRRALALSWRVLLFWLAVVVLIAAGDLLGIFAGW